jgi:AcrR family transcriptional regulator
MRESHQPLSHSVAQPPHGSLSSRIQAEVSPSTFFRYFPTKEDVALHDGLDEQILDAFRSQPPGLSPIRAVRESFRTVFANLSPEDLACETERQAVIRAVPELRGQVLETLKRSRGPSSDHAFSLKIPDHERGS